MEIELEPDLSHCIQTLAKGKYDKIMRALLQFGEVDTEDRHRLEMLKVFLESTDFSQLRSEYEPYLVEGKKVKFILRSMADKIEYQMEVR